MLVFSLLLSFVGSGYSLTLPFTRDLRPRSTTVEVNPSANWSNLNFQNFADNRYTVTLYANGKPFQVQLDTGSSDLWLDPVVAGVSMDGLIDTGFNATVSYLDTTAASGPVQLANVTIGGFTVVDQAFIFAPGSNASIPDVFDGLLGLAAPTVSVVNETLAASPYDGSPFLDNVFGQQPDEDPIITFLLSRSGLGFTEGGFFSIGEINSNFSNITSAPKLEVLIELLWITAMDGIKVNGQFYDGNGVSSLDEFLGLNTTQTTIILDTGTSAALAPPYYVDAMYAQVPGAVFDGVDSYTLPCDTKINISMVFGDYEYPMHPIDAIEMGIDANNSVICTGAFSYSNTDTGVDFILGDAFMRNVYSLFNYGNWTDVGSGPAFMQMLSITDPDEAWVEFDSILQAFLSTWQAAAQSGNIPDNPLTSVFPTSLYPESTASTAWAASTSSSWVGTAAPTNYAQVGGALDEVSGASVSPDSSSADLNPLTRNTYIIIGMLGAVLALLIAILARMIMTARRGRQYAPVPVHVGAPAGHAFREIKPEESYSESYSTPYDDGGR